MFGDSRNNFQTSIAIGRMFIPLCFFRKGAPNDVFIYLKRSPSNLTLGQCKFDLRSMSMTSKLRQIAYNSTRLDGAEVLILFCGYPGSKGNYQKTKPVLRELEKVFVIYSENFDVFFYLQFSGIMRIIEEN